MTLLDRYKALLAVYYRVIDARDASGFVTWFNGEQRKAGDELAAAFDRMTPQEQGAAMQYARACYEARIGTPPTPEQVEAARRFLASSAHRISETP